MLAGRLRTGGAAWHCADVFAAAVISMLLCFLSPFGLDDVTAKASRDVFYRFWTVAYPQAGRPKVSVVLLSDADLRGGIWPAPYAMHAAALQSLKRFKPQAVAIDLVFIDERNDETLPDLVDAIKDLSQNNNISVFLATASQTGAPRPIRKELQHLIDTGAAMLADVSTGEKSGESRQYKLRNAPGSTQPLALAVHDDLCRKQPDKCQQPISSLDQFELWWAGPPPLANCNASAPAKSICENISYNSLVRAAKLTLKGIAGRLITINEADPIGVAPHTTVSWTSLRKGDLSSSTREAVTESVVFYSADVAFARDLAANPVYGTREERELPGVYHHAMAYDNIVTLKSALIHQSDLTDLAHSALIISLILMGSLLVRLFMNWCVGENSSMRYAETLDFLVWLGCAVAIACVEFNHFHLSPGNWIGALLAVNAGGLFRGWVRDKTLQLLGEDHAH